MDHNSQNIVLINYSPVVELVASHINGLSWCNVIKEQTDLWQKYNRFSVIDQNNILTALIHNLKNAWPIDISMP